MSVRERIEARDTVSVLRAGALALAGLAMAGTAIELATERHWNSPIQLVPWFALAVLAVALGLLAVQPGRAAVTAARILAVLVLLVSAYGVIEHVTANANAGVLDGMYSSIWDSLPVSTQLWYAVTKTVGPSPPLAPGVLAQAALLILLAAWRHPATVGANPELVGSRAE